MGLGHREQPKIGEESIWPLFVIAYRRPPHHVFHYVLLEKPLNKF
jgi:hypothetical protein